MKKLLILLTVLFASLTLAACNINLGSGEKTEPTTGENQANQLAAPTVTVDESGLASWNTVENAVGYIYKLNGKEQATMKTSLQLSNGDELAVKAKGDGKNYTDSDYSETVTYTAQAVVGLPEPASGFYMRDADILQDGDVRYLVYTTNKSAHQEDNVIAIRKAELTADGWVYGDQAVVLEGSADGWDQYLGSASVTKGEFALNGETYNWLMVYQGTKSDSNVSNSLGLAVAKDIMGEWVKIEAPVVEYNAEVYGANMVGCYAPSVVNYNKVSGIRIFYTYADAYGHFAYFYDVDLSDLSKIDGVSAMITNSGNLQGGDAVLMFPNADFLYDSANAVFYAVKDYSPSPSTKPAFADQIELCHIAEEELYTIGDGEGWVSDFYKDYIDLDNGYERAYSACIVSDVYGHKLEGNFEVVYNVCEIGNDYLHTQKLMTYIAE